MARGHQPKTPSPYALEAPAGPRATSPRRGKGARSTEAQAACQEHGEEAEQLVAAHLEVCRLAKLGRLKKRPTAVIVREGKPIYTGTAGVDFSGHLRPSGRAVYLEVKFTSEPRFELDMLRTSQREELAEGHEGGAVAVVLILRGPVPHASRWSAVPWRVVAEAIAREDVSLGPEVLDAWRLPGAALLLTAPAFREGDSCRAA
jgi:hypothetical protein